MRINPYQPASRALRLPEVLDIVGISRTSLYRLLNSDPTFPRPYKLSPGITVWDAEDVHNYLSLKKLDVQNASVRASEREAE